jgi:hypothetical protein
MNLNDDVVYRCPRLGPLHELHPGRSRSLVRHHYRLHRPLPQGPNVPNLSRGGGEADDVGCSARLGGSAIDVFAVPDPNDEDEEFRICDRVKNSIPPSTNPISILLARQFLAPGRPGISGQRSNAGHDALAVLLLINGLDLLGRGRLE